MGHEAQTANAEDLDKTAPGEPNFALASKGREVLLRVHRGLAKG